MENRRNSSFNILFTMKIYSNTDFFIFTSKLFPENSQKRVSLANDLQLTEFPRTRDELEGFRIRGKVDLFMAGNKL